MRRAGGELRAMDGVNTGGNERSFDRLGTERYIVTLPQTNLSGAKRCAERIRAAITRYPIEGRYPVTVSGGVVEYRRGETVNDLLDRAEDSLLQARDAGGNRVAGYEPVVEVSADVIPLPGVSN